MAYPSPIQHLHDAAEPLIGLYGTPERPIPVIQAFDPIEVEYAAIRRHAGLFDQPHRGVLEFRGPDRVAFLNRMLTQNLADPAINAALGAARNSFLLDRKGRIAADLRLLVLSDRVLALGDVFAIERVHKELEKYIITEDVTITDLTGSHHTLTIHGPAAAAILAAHAGGADGADLAALAPNTVAIARIAESEAVVNRHDWCGEIGIDLIVETPKASAIYETLSTPWSARTASDAAAPQTALARRIGWHALNIARIEAGTALYMLDFGPTSLPHETGDATLADRVSFKKGCYLGQEIVARMQSLGHPKQKLVGLRVQDHAAQVRGLRPQAETGAPVLDSDQPGAAIVGAITSSAFSPMNGGAPVCFAMVKFAHAIPEKTLFVRAGDDVLRASAQTALSFLQKP